MNLNLFLYFAHFYLSQTQIIFYNSNIDYCSFFIENELNIFPFNILIKEDVFLKKYYKKFNITDIYSKSY